MTDPSNPRRARARAWRTGSWLQTSAAGSRILRSVVTPPISGVPLVAVTLDTNLGYHWAAVEVQGFHGMGMVLPRLSVTLKMSQLTVGDKVRVEGLAARLKLDSELLV